MANSLFSSRYSSRQLRVVSFSDNAIKFFETTKIREFFSSYDSNQLNDLFKSMDKPRQPKALCMGIQSFLEGTDLI